MVFPGSSAGKESSSNCRRSWFYSQVRKIPWRKAWQPTPVFWHGESPWTEELGRLQSMRSQRVVHNWVTKHTAHAYWYSVTGRLLKTITDPLAMHVRSFTRLYCITILIIVNQRKLRRRQWHPTPVLLAGKSHGRRSLVGCSPWGC